MRETEALVDGIEETGKLVMGDLADSIQRFYSLLPEDMFETLPYQPVPLRNP